MKWALTTVALVCVAIGFADDVKWTKVEPKDGDCSVEFPSKPETNVDDKTNTTRVSLETMEGKGVYMLQYNRLPNKVKVDEADVVKKIFESGQKGLETSLKAKVVKSDDGKLGKYPTRDIDLEVPQLGLYRVKLVITGDRFYQLTAAGPADFVKGNDVKKFMESLKFND